MNVHFKIDMRDLKVNQIFTGDNAEAVVAELKKVVVAQLPMALRPFASVMSSLAFAQEVIRRCNANDQTHHPLPKSCDEFLEIGKQAGIVTVVKPTAKEAWLNLPSQSEEKPPSAIVAKREKLPATGEMPEVEDSDLLTEALALESPMINRPKPTQTLLEEREVDIAKLRNELAEAKSELKRSKEWVFRYEADIIDKKRILQNQEQTIADLRREIETHKQDNSRILKEVKALASRKTALETELEELRRKAARQTPRRQRATNPAVLQAELRKGVETAPSSLARYIEDLLEMMALTASGDVEGLERNFDKIERAIYRAPETAGMLAHQGMTDLSLLQRILDAQKWMHERLTELGLRLIAPEPGEPFDATRHACQHDRDIIRTNQDPALHNTIHSLTRIGFYNDVTRAVGRRAQVKRRFYVGEEGVATVGG